MIISIIGLKVRLIGDPHLGRKFEVGVPLDRRGEREKNVIEDFQARVRSRDMDLTICMGDLFDKFAVPPEIELAAIDAYTGISNKEQFIIMGNHDGSRDKLKRSSFDVFCSKFEKSEKVRPVKDAPLFYQGKNGNYICIIPWDAFVNAEEMAQAAIKIWEAMKKPVVEAVFGHWDLEDFAEFGGDTTNLVPVQTLRQMTKMIYTGHVHKATKKVIADVEIISTGSMQPYAHGEDSGTDVYETLTLEELRQRDPATLKNKCIRVALQEGEEMPNDIDCLQMTRLFKKKKPGEEAEEVRVEQFDLDRLLNEALDEKEVPKLVRDRITAKFAEMKK